MTTHPVGTADLVKRLRQRADEDRAIQKNNEAVASALMGQRLLFDQGIRSNANTFAVRLGLDYENCAKKDAKLSQDWGDAADRIEQLVATVEQLEAALTRANAERDNLLADIAVKGGTSLSPTQDAYDAACRAIEKHRAATAAAYEVVSKQLAASRETFCYASPGSDEEFTSLLLGFDTAAGILSSLATPDQTAALDRLIAEAVNTSMQGVERWEIPVQSIEHCLDRMVVMSSQEADTKKSLRLWLLSLAASKKVSKP